MSGEQAEETKRERAASDESTVRKRLFQALGGAGAVGIAGCLGDGGEKPADDVDDAAGNGGSVDDEDAEAGDDDPDDDEDEIDEDPDTWIRDHDWEPDPDAATDWDNYEVTQLGDEIDNLMAIDVAPDGKVWYVERGELFPTYGDGTCEVGWVDDDAHAVALELEVSLGSIPEDWPDDEWEAGDEEPPEMAARELGGQGVAVDPDFEDNGYVYVWYHPSSEEQETVENPYHEEISTANARVSRFEYDDGELDPASEAVVLEIPYNRTTCCHHGGYLEFGPEGHLYVTTGDDSNNVGNPDDEINWFMGDERQEIVHGRPAPVSDAQRTAANTADLRGSILRITPTDDGDYEIPEGNLLDVYEEAFDVDVDDEEFRPEIYALGFRNPYVISVDEHTGNLWVSDYAPDGTSWEEEMGPMGIATHHMIAEPIFGGWPYFKGYYPYRDRDYEFEDPGQPFWPDRVVNDSPNNTGVERLPDFTPATLWHANDWDAYVEAADWVDMPRPGEITWPELPASGSANAGVAYRYAEDSDDGALDPYFEGKQFFMTPFAAGGWIGYVGFDEDGSVDIGEFLPEEFDVPTDMEVLPDGRSVVMDYGAGFDGEGGGIYLIEYEG